MFLNMLSFEDVGIMHNIPDYLVAGSSYDIDVTIEKGSIEGFAKFQMEVPDGINVKSVEISNSSFTFNDGVIKNIWMTIPDASEIILSYKFSVAPNYQGTGTIKAQFVYIKENERYSVAMSDHLVTIGDEGGVAEVVSIEDATFVPELIKGHRSVKPISATEFEVKIKIEKDGLEGFAKIQDELPYGYTAELLFAGESVFSVIEDKIKFIWFNVPASDVLEVSYLLKATDESEGGERLKGTFNFIYKDDARFIDLPEEELIFDKVEEVLIVEEEPVIVEETVTAAVIIESEPEPVIIIEPEPEPEPVVEVRGPQGEIFYRVQIAASKRNVKVTYFKNKFSFRGEIYLENHKTWYKYTTGNYDKYLLARNRREEIKSAYQFRGPFVTAYNAGERITVQEALLISKQKWVK